MNKESSEDEEETAGTQRGQREQRGDSRLTKRAARTKRKQPVHKEDSESREETAGEQRGSEDAEETAS